PRYRWLGALPRGRALEELGRAQLLSLTSVMEGGANVVSEAIAYGVPIVSSDVPGSRGLLGGDYPGFFPVGDTAVRAGLLRRAAEDAAFLSALREHGAQLRPLVAPERELAAWAELVDELR